MGIILPSHSTRLWVRYIGDMIPSRIMSNGTGLSLGCECMPNSSTPEVTPILVEMEIISIKFRVSKTEDGVITRATFSRLMESPGY
jgi:hypothetical protein